MKAKPNKTGFKIKPKKNEKPVNRPSLNYTIDQVKFKGISQQPVLGYFYYLRPEIISGSIIEFRSTF